MNIEVLVATYNGENYIKQQLESICTQSRKPDSIIITDGGSQDSTLDFCYEYLKKSGINFNILESQKQLNVTENFTKGIKHSGGDIIFFSDQDDVWCENKIEKIEHKFLNEFYDIVFCNAYVVNYDLSRVCKKNSLGYCRT